MSVLDDVLAPPDFEAIANQLAGSAYAEKDVGTDYWKPRGEAPREATKLLYLRPGADTLRERFGQSMTICPGSAPFDDLFRVIVDAASDAAIVSPSDPEWGGAVAIPYSFGPGARTNWHVDAGHRADAGPYYGAFVFYTHTTWNENWGGELLFADAWGDDTGCFLAPKPNRLVLIRGATPHSVSRVSETALSARRSLTGFFFRCSGIESMVTGEGLA